ncbi:mechanosensitive ion channel family protein [Thermodesulfobacteriota bacterium]
MRHTFTYFFVLLAFCLNTPNLAANERYPLEAPDTSSPRATLKSFQTIIENANPIVEKVRTLGFSREITRELRDLRTQAMRCIDLSQVPQRLREDVGPEAVVLLAEILGRIDLPPYRAIPDADALESKEVSRWRIPHTEITIARVEEGSRQGEYLFTAGTVDRLREFFSKVRDLPYSPGAVIKKIGPAGGWYEYYSASPRGLVPIRLIESLPSWARSVYFDHAVWQWIGMMLTLVIGLLVIVLIYILIRWWTKGREGASIWRGLARLILPLSAAVIVLIVDNIAKQHIGMRGLVYDVIGILTWALLLIFVIWFVVAFGSLVANAIIASPRVDPRGINAELTKIACSLITWAIAGIIFFKGLSELGISLIPLLTGLGVGGLAVALAARPTIENLIGGLMILADKPYRVGQRIKVRDNDGIVQQIGLRSTKIRLLSGPQATIPNEEMAKAEIENVARRQYIKRSSNITIKYDTPPEKVEKAVDIIKDILNDHEGMDPKRPPRVHFTEFNPDSLNISMMYWYHPAKFWKSRAFDQKINLRIMQEFGKEGIKFAYPTTTTYLAQEDEQPLHFVPFRDASSSEGSDNKSG